MFFPLTVRDFLERAETVFPDRVAMTQPRFLVRIEGGTLESLVAVDGRSLKFNGWTFNELDGFAAPFHVYRR